MAAMGAVIDAIDIVGVLRRFPQLPAGRRWAALLATGVPAAVGAALVAAIDRQQQ